MPLIKSIDDLKYHYDEISQLCHDMQEAVFITKDGNIDLVIISIEAYEKLTSSFEIYELLKDGIQDIENGNTRTFTDAITEIKSKRKR